ncbi:hypothetical protein [Aquabacterium sp.]|uniref:hypothetical protein n=1 Tax=Aquabacterium sp. TaxID=1872578 RepID=UPI0025C6C7D8|nr:hypothetical protein [Aquabacterium sp.]
MQMRPDIQIRSILKAMSDVILPAIDDQNQLAQEQARLCMGLLQLMSKQLPLQYRYDCDELTRLLDMGQQLLALADGDAASEASAAALKQGVALASQVRARAMAEPQEVLEAVRQLRAVSGSFLQEAYAKAEIPTALERIVLDTSRAQLLRERAWLVAQGWEARPEDLPDIGTLLAAVFDPSTSTEAR